MLKILIIAGARPNFMKVAPIIKAITAYNSNCNDANGRLNFSLVHTGQHYDQKMSDVHFLRNSGHSRARHQSGRWLRFPGYCRPDRERDDQDSSRSVWSKNQTGSWW